jgi:hypothetical protein
MEPAQKKKSRRRSPKAILRLPDLEHAKSAVLNSLASPESRRSYEFAIQNFVQWYCSEPRLALNRIVVTRYRMRLEQLHLAPSTINQRLAQCEGRLQSPAPGTGTVWVLAKQPLSSSNRIGLGKRRSGKLPDGFTYIRSPAPKTRNGRSHVTRSATNPRIATAAQSSANQSPNRV